MNEYSKTIHNKSSEIGRELISKILEKKDIFVPDVLETDADKLKAQEAALDFGNEIMQYLATKDLPARYATMGIDKLIDALTGLKSFVDGTLNMYEDEYMSRMFGVKNPEGKYRRELATVGTIVLKLEEAKQATGNKREEFFNEKAPIMPVNPELSSAVASPYVPPTNPNEMLAI